MKSKAWTNAGLVAALAGATSFGSITFAADKPSDKPAGKPVEKPRLEARAEAEVLAVVAPAKHWIGLHAAPISDEALQSQLNLKDRLIVVHVMPDSPSAKSGVNQHDILLKFGDRELANLEDLIKAVNDNGDKESTLLLLRGGKETKLTIKPTERPKEDVVLKLHDTVPQGLRLWLDERHASGPAHFNLRVLGPGIAAGAFGPGHQAFPNGLTLSVSKENDEPAKIVAKKDGKTYETTEDQLGELPEDIREHVQRLLSAPQMAVFSNETLKDLHGAHPQVQEELKKAIESAKKAAAELRTRAEGESKGVRNRIEVRRTETGPIDELRKELDSLRKEVEKLKGESKSEPKPESSDKLSEEK